MTKKILSCDERAWFEWSMWDRVEASEMPKHALKVALVGRMGTTDTEVGID
jgi:hypothetical protein